MGKSSDFPQNLSLTVEKKDGDCLVAAMHFSTLTGDFTRHICLPQEIDQSLRFNDPLQRVRSQILTRYLHPW